MSAIGVAVCAMYPIVLSGIAGIGMSNTENGTPRTIPIMIGFFNILINAFFIPAAPLCLSFPPNVSAMTDMTLYIGTAATIMSGAIPELPHIFSTNATPSTAALPLAAP